MNQTIGIELKSNYGNVTQFGLQTSDYYSLELTYIWPENARLVINNGADIHMRKGNKVTVQGKYFSAYVEEMNDGEWTAPDDYEAYLLANKL